MRPLDVNIVEGEGTGQDYGYGWKVMETFSKRIALRVESPPTPLMAGYVRVNSRIMHHALDLLGSIPGLRHRRSHIPPITLVALQSL